MLSICPDELTSQLGTLRNALWDGRAKWKDIGIDLKIATGTLEVCIVTYPVIYRAVRMHVANFACEVLWTWDKKRRNLRKEEHSITFVGNSCSSPSFHNVSLKKN